MAKFDSDCNLISSSPALIGSEALAVDGQGNLYVSNYRSTSGNPSQGWQIQKLDSNFNPLGRWYSYGIGSGQFWDPCSIAVGQNGNLYIADGISNRVIDYVIDYVPPKKNACAALLELLLLKK